VDPYKFYHKLEELYNEVDGRDETDYRTGYLDAVQFILEIVEEELE
jgi:hypothetical protein